MLIFTVPSSLIRDNPDVNSVLRPLHHVVVGGVADVLEVHAASIFRGKVSV